MTFEKLKERYEQLKMEAMKAEVNLNNIKESWVKHYGTDDVAKIKEIAECLNRDLAEANQRYTDLMEKAENKLLELETWNSNH